MIPLWKYIPIINVKKYKLHYMRSNEQYGGNKHPYYCKKEDLMTGWQNWRGNKNRWGQADYIFALLQDPKNIDKWFFAGIYKILQKNPTSYETTILDNYEELLGRLKIKHDYKGQDGYPYLSTHYNKLEIYEILSEPCKPLR